MTNGQDDLSVNLRSLSDAELDAFYSAARGVPRQLASLEIIDRLDSVWSFVSGAFGKTRFPLYEQSPFAFHQVETAQGAIATRAGDVAGSLKLWGGGLIIAVALLAIAYILFKVKK